MALRNALRRARAEQGLSQRALAELAGTSRQTVAAVESAASVPSIELALRLARALGRRVDDLFALPAAGEAPRRTLVIGGSDDPGLAVLAERLRARGQDLLLSLSVQGSSAGLASVVAGSADLAGIHLDDNAARVRAALADAAILHFARREQGLLLGRGVTLRSLDGLRRLRLALRQPGSGTRALSDRVVARGDARRVAEVSTHDQVAAAVLRGDADAGTALRATARRYGLRFFPLAWERFDLALRRALLDDPRVRLLRTALTDRANRRAIEALGGYDLAAAGEVTLA